MTRRSFKRWLWVHKWSSLICTLFLLVTCLTGLPLVFADELNDFFEDAPPYASLPVGTPNLSIDRFVEESRKLYPNEVVLSVFVDDDEPKAIVSMAPSWAEYRKNIKSAHRIRFDSRTAQVMKQTKPYGEDDGLLRIIFEIHKNFLAGLAGELMMAGVALIFLAAIVSGVLIYAPFMRRLEFATIRPGRRVRWLDFHNLLGIATTVWLLIVGFTGFVNELSTPLFGYWQQTEATAMSQRLQGLKAPDGNDLSSAQSAFDTAQAALPHMKLVSVIFPGSPFGTPFHYVVWTKGDQPLTSKLFSPVLVDGRTGKLFDVLQMPWYLRVLELSRPLHFGDYGGQPLKVIWVLLDLVAIAVLITGLYLWVSRFKSPRSDLEDALIAGRSSSAGHSVAALK